MGARKQAQGYPRNGMLHIRRILPRNPDCQIQRQAGCRHLRRRHRLQAHRGLGNSGKTPRRTNHPGTACLRRLRIHAPPNRLRHPGRRGKHHPETGKATLRNTTATHTGTGRNTPRKSLDQGRTGQTDGGTVLPCPGKCLPGREEPHIRNRGNTAPENLRKTQKR